MIDPNFAPAYASLAICYVNIRIGSMGGPRPRELFPRAKAAANKALELDKTLGEAHAALAAVKFFFEWDWHAPEQDYQRAVELEPQNTNVLLMYDPYLILTGRFDEGIALHKRAIELDPLSPFVSLTLGFGYSRARRYDEGIAHLRKMFQLYPNHPIAFYQISWQYVLNGMYKEAIAAVEKGPEPAQRAYIYAVSGRRADALKVLEEVLDYSQREYFDPFYIAVIYMGLGDTEKTFQWLNKAYEERTCYMVWLKTEPVFDQIRSDPRYVELCRKVGLEE